MARGPRYRVPLKRRRLGVTNYYKRRKMVLSGKPRLVVRKSNRHIVAQVVDVSPRGDITLVAAHSRELVSYGWKGYLNNTPAAYLVGLLVGKRALEKGIREAILDIGLHRATPGARVFAVAKGAVDAGLKVPLGEEVVPSDDRIRGEHIAAYGEELEKKDPEKYRRLFSKYLEKGLKPQDIPNHFNEVRERILGHF